MKHKFHHPIADEQFGQSVDAAGDANADGWPDVVIGAPWADFGGVYNCGAVHLISGRDGSTLWTAYGLRLQHALGGYVGGGGDVNRDGFDDVIAGNFALGSEVLVFSGFDGTVLFTFVAPESGFGRGVDVAGDLNADGYDDVVVGSSEDHVFAYSGADGSLLFSVTLATDSQAAVAGVGDVNLDGHDDVLAGAAGDVFSPAAYLISGKDGRTLRVFDYAPGSYTGLGHAVGDAGDVNADGVPDIVIGAPGADRFLINAGAAYVYSGRYYLRLHQFDGWVEGLGLGSAVDGAGDANGDGHADLIISAGADAVLYSGADGSILTEYASPYAGVSLGGPVAGAGDVDRDGFDDVIFGDPAANAAGIAGLIPFLTLSADELSLGSGNPVTAAIAFPESEAGYRYALLASITGTGPTTLYGIEVPLTPDKVFNRMLSGSVSPANPDAFGVLDAHGRATAGLFGHVSLTPLLGANVYLAAVSYDMLGPLARLSSVSRALAIVP